MSLTKNPKKKRIIQCPMEVLAWWKKSSSRYDRISDVQGVHGKHRTVRRDCLSEPLTATTLSRVSPEQELLLFPIDGAITLASYGTEFENVFFIRDLSGVTFVLRRVAFDKIVLLSVWIKSFIRLGYDVTRKPVAMIYRLTTVVLMHAWS